VYKSRKGQQSILDDARVFGGELTLDTNNDWVRKAALIPWDELEALYAATFNGLAKGNPAKPARMAIGTLLIKEWYRFSDEDVVKEVQMNPYLQHFIGLTEFTHKAPYDASTITLFRKRVTTKMLKKLNDSIIGLEPKEDDEREPPGDCPPGGSEMETKGTVASAETVASAKTKGTLILDAVCTPQAIRYPTDISLLNEAREFLEKMVTHAYRNGAWQQKPRTYCRKARKDYLRYARNRKPSQKGLRKALKHQLGYVFRDIRYIQELLESNEQALPERMLAQYRTILCLYKQQHEMYEKKTHRVENRIVSIHQPWVRPIVRGKATAPVEFGAKVEVALYDGYARIEKLSWDAFNEGTTLVSSAQRFKKATGHFPARILADKLFRTRENLSFCKDHGIRMNGPKLGRPPKDRELYRKQCRMERAEAGERNAIEGTFGTGRRRYGLGYITTRLQHTSEVAIHLSFLSMNLQKRLRSLLRIFLQHSFSMILESISLSDYMLQEKTLFAR
jgi:hypothetical protein